MTSDQGDRSAGESSQETDDGSSVLEPIKDAALKPVKEVAKVASEKSAPVLADILLDAVFSDAVRTRLLREAEEGLQDLIDSALKSLPASASSGQLQREVNQAERRLHAVLQEAMDRIFSGPVRARFQGHLEEAARLLAEGDSDAAKDEAAEALQSLLSEILKVLQRHWAETLRLLLGITVRALEASFTSHLKEALGSITAHTAEEMEEKVEPFQEKIAERAQDLRERLIETRDTLQERLGQARDEVQERLATAMPGTAKGSQRQSNFGAPPSRRPPAGPTDRRPPGKAPTGRPPSISR